MSYDIWTECHRKHACGCGSSDHGWNYTSNCSGMWRKAMPATDGLAGLHGMKATSAAKHVRKGIARMEADPDTYRAMNPPNGWGAFDTQLEALDRLAVELERAGCSIVVVSR